MALVRAADRDRYLATLFAPAAHRDALYALYAFNAEIMRVRDVAREPMPGEIRLQWWRELLEGQRDGEAAAHPVAAALRETIARHNLRPSLLVSLIDAHGFDRYDEPMASASDLESYCIRTQSGLFTLAGTILAGAPVAEMGALDCGVAYAIAGILNDFGRHAMRRQLYVPLDILRRHGVSPDDVFAAIVSNGLRAALADMREIARQHLALARAKLSLVPPDALPALLPMALVAPTLDRLERQEGRPFHARPLSRLHRQWLLWRAARHPARLFG